MFQKNKTVAVVTKMKRISRILQMPEKVISDMIQHQEYTLEDGRKMGKNGKYETKRYQIEFEEEDELEVVESGDEVVGDDADNDDHADDAELRETLHIGLEDNSESGSESGSENDRENDRENDSEEVEQDSGNGGSLGGNGEEMEETEEEQNDYREDSDYEDSFENNATNAINKKNKNIQNNHKNPNSNPNSNPILANKEIVPANGNIYKNIENEKKILELEIELRKVRRDLKKKTSEVEHLRNQVRIQDMIYFEKFIPVSEFIQNMKDRYDDQDRCVGGGIHLEQYEKMADEWKQYLDVIPIYEIKNIIYYIQNTDNITQQNKDDFYRIIDEFYEYLTRMKEENIYASRRNKIQDMWREWSKYANLFHYHRSSQNAAREVTGTRRVGAGVEESESTKEMIQKTLTMAGNVQMQSQLESYSHNKKKAGKSGKVGKMGKMGEKKKKEEILLDL
jgi:hypothetical protein